MDIITVFSDYIQYKLSIKSKYLDEWLLFAFNNCDIDCDMIIVATIYVDRIMQNNLVKNNISEYYLAYTTLLLAYKYHDDDDIWNEEWHHFSNCVVDLYDIYKMEIYFLNLLEYRLFVKRKEFIQKCIYLLLSSKNFNFIKIILPIIRNILYDS